MTSENKPVGVKRYECGYFDDSMYPVPNGRWVRIEEHQCLMRIAREAFKQIAEDSHRKGWTSTVTDTQIAREALAALGEE